MNTSDSDDGIVSLGSDSDADYGRPGPVKRSRPARVGRKIEVKNRGISHTKGKAKAKAKAKAKVPVKQSTRKNAKQSETSYKEWDTDHDSDLASESESNSNSEKEIIMKNPKISKTNV